MVEKVIKAAKSLQIWPFLVEFGEKLAQKPLIFDLLEHAHANFLGLGYLSVPGSIKKHQKSTFTLFYVKKTQEIEQLPILGLDWQNLLQFSIDIDYDLAYLGRFTGPQATFMSSGCPKTIEKAFFNKIIPSQSCGMPIEDVKVAQLKAPKILQIQIGVKKWVFAKNLGSF